MFDMVLSAADKLAGNLLYPIFEEMDRNQPELAEGQVKVHPAVKKSCVNLEMAAELQGRCRQMAQAGLCVFRLSARGALVIVTIMPWNNIIEIAESTLSMKKLPPFKA